MDTGTVLLKVAIEIGLHLSSISPIITDLDSSKSWLNSLSQLNGLPGLSIAGENDSTRSVYDTWLINPNQERTFVILVVVGKLQILSRYFFAWPYIVWGRSQIPRTQQCPDQIQTGARNV